MNIKHNIVDTNEGPIEKMDLLEQVEKIQKTYKEAILVAYSYGENPDEAAFTKIFSVLAKTTPFEELAQFRLELFLINQMLELIKIKDFKAAKIVLKEITDLKYAAEDLVLFHNTMSLAGISYLQYKEGKIEAAKKSMMSSLECTQILTKKPHYHFLDFRLIHLKCNLIRLEASNKQAIDRASAMCVEVLVDFLQKHSKEWNHNAAINAYDISIEQIMAEIAFISKQQNKTDLQKFYTQLAAIKGIEKILHLDTWLKTRLLFFDDKQLLRALSLLNEQIGVVKQMSPNLWHLLIYELFMLLEPFSELKEVKGLLFLIKSDWQSQFKQLPSYLKGV